MTVRELIEALQGQDPDLKVVISGATEFYFADVSWGMVDVQSAGYESGYLLAESGPQYAHRAAFPEKALVIRPKKYPRYK